MYRKVCDALHEQIERTLLELQTMQTSYLSVADRSRSLQDACERLLEQQTHLASLAESVGDRLSFFNELEGIARLFNTPGEVVVLHERFLPSLNRLDQCLAYIDANVRRARTPLRCSTRAPAGCDAHRGRRRGGGIGRGAALQPSYKDAELYRMKFRQCLTRGLTLIKMYFSEVLHGLLTELSTRITKDKARLRACRAAWLGRGTAPDLQSSAGRVRRGPTPLRKSRRRRAWRRRSCRRASARSRRPCARC